MNLKILSLTVGTSALILGSAIAKDKCEIVFLPSSTLDANKKTGKLKPNTIYWSNVTDNPNEKPTVRVENGKEILQVKGIGTKQSDKKLSVTRIVRVFPIPEKSNSLTINAEIRRQYDEWLESANRFNGVNFHFSYFKDGQETRKGSKIPLPTESDNTWRAVSTNTSIPAGAQYIAINLETDLPNRFELALLRIDFN